MALTERLPLTSGTNRVIDDPGKVPVLGELMDFASGTLNGYMNLRKDMAADKAARRRSEEEAAKTAAGTDAYQSATRIEEAANTRAPAPVSAPELPPEPENLLFSAEGPSAEVFASEDPLSTEIPADLQKTISAAGTKIQNVTAAVEQGRMPAISVTTALNSEWRRLINQHPGQEETIIEAWKKLGIDTNLFRASRDAADQLDENRESQQRGDEDNRKFFQGVDEMAIGALGPELASTLTREQRIERGLSYMKQNFELDLQQKATTLATQNAALTVAQRAEVEKDNNQEIERNLLTNMYGDGAPIVTMVQKLASAISKKGLGTGQAQAEFDLLAPRVNQMFENYVAQAKNVALQRGYTGDPAKLETQLRSQFDRVKQLFAGDFSMAQANNKALGAVTTALKLKTHEALPVFMAVRETGLDPNTMPGVMEGIQSNPALQESLRNDIKGYNTDFGRDRASEHLMNIIKVLRGEKTFADMPAHVARQEMPTFYKSVEAITRDYVQGKNEDTESVINGVGEITIAANALAPSSGVQAHTLAVAGFGSRATRQALTKALKDPNADKPMVIATIQASRAASAHVLNNFQANMIKINQSSKYFALVFDSKNGTVKVDDSKKRAEVARLRKDVSNLRGVGSGNETSSTAYAAAAGAKIPKEMELWVKTANTALDNIVALGPLDPSTPKGSVVEIRNYYGDNKPLKSLQNTADSIDPDKEIKTLFNSIEDVLDKNLTAGNEPVPSAGTTNYTENPRYAEVAPVVTRMANKYEIPEGILGSLLDFESGFNPNKPGPVIKSGTHAGDRAMGMGQVMAKTAAAYGITDRASLNPTQQIDLAARVLADNKKAGGTWKDAVSRYFTGVDYATAKKQGRTDGYTDVFNYVESIIND